MVSRSNIPSVKSPKTATGSSDCMSCTELGPQRLKKCGVLNAGKKWFENPKVPCEEFSPLVPAQKLVWKVFAQP